MANPRKFSEKIALLNQKQAEETARYEQIIREVADVTRRPPKSASASASASASPTGTTGGAGNTSATSVPETTPRQLPMSAGASPPQMSGKHLHINLGQQYKLGGSLPNVAGVAPVAGVVAGKDLLVIGGAAVGPGPGQVATSAAIHSIDLKTALSNLEEMQHNQAAYRQGGGTGTGGAQERGRSMGPGPMRSRPIEKRHDTSPYSGVPYLSPPLPENWRRANSDSALHQSSNEACQSVNSSMGHRRGSDTYQRGHSGSTTDTRDTGHHHHGFIERPRSSCDMPRVPGINVYPSSQPPGQQIPIGNNTGSLPDLSNVHFPSPLHTPLDQEDHSSGSQYSNSPQTSSPTTLSPTSLAQAGRLSLTQDHSPPSAQNHLSVPNHRFLHSCKGIAVDNNTSTSQQDVRIGYNQQQQQPPGPMPAQAQSVPVPTSQQQQQHPGVAHSPVHYVYQQPHSPVAPQSPNASQAQVHQQSSPSQYSSLNSYRTSQMVNRPSPQSSPSLTLQGSPSYSNNPSAPSSPTGHHGPPNLSLGPDDQNIFVNQIHADFEQFSMDWVQMMQQLEDTGYTLSTQLDEMDSPSTTIGPYMNSPSHSGTYSQSDVLGVASEIGSADGGYFSTSPLQPLAYHTARTPTTTQQLTPQTPNTPTITLTDCSLADELVSTDYSKDYNTSMTTTYEQDLFNADDALTQDLNSLRHEDINALRQGLDPIDLDELQRLANSDMVISDPTAEADFRLEQR